MAYYDYTELLAQGAIYNLIIGQRSNGKTFGACRLILEEYLKTGTPSAYIRRLEEQIKPKNIEALFNPHSAWIDEQTEHKYNSVVYRAGGFYLARFELSDKTGRFIKLAQDRTPFCRCYAIATADTTKGQDAGPVAYVVFDEFMTRKYYLVNEFIHYQNLLSSIIRDRQGVRILMLANTVNKYCPYFGEMGLREIADQDQGTIAVYTAGTSETKIAVEYCASDDEQQKKVSSYFCFDNPQLNMISTGAWEIASYRHAPEDTGDYDIIFCFFVVYGGKVAQGDIYMYKGYPIIVFHKKTSELRRIETSLIYMEDNDDGNPLHQISLTVGETRAHKLIRQLIKQNKFFFDTNDTGEYINNWLKFALTNTIVKG